MIEKLKMEQSPLSETVEKIKEICPAAVTSEGKIDFEELKTALSDDVAADAIEKYEFTWVGKNAARVETNRPIRKTLRPVVADSKNWDTTKNLYIEGDNLDALKLLQESYLGKVKMIYIDPPYNTGNDFVYCDEFAVGCEEYLDKKGCCDSDGNRLFKNTETNGRFHSDWCSMIYSRLKIARDLLSDDGVIFVSIDDHEVANLRKICDEIFGEDNFISQFIWRRSGSGGLRGQFPITTHEYIICYSKHKFSISKDWLAPYSDDSIAAFNGEDERGVFKTQALYLTSLRQTDAQSYFIELPDGTHARPPVGRGSWRFIESTYKEKLNNDEIVFKKVNSSPLVLQDGSKASYNIYTKQYINDAGTNPATMFPDNIVGQTRSAKAELAKLFRKNIFDYAKPVALIKYIIKMAGIKESIILDFFSGSATTAHAVMQLNAEDSGNRRFIMVQLPEETDPKSEAAKAGYKNICEIGKERIRRAGEKIKAENPDKDLDIGFRVLRIDSTNMKDVYYKPSDTTQKTLLDAVDNIKADRSDMDLLFGVMVDCGLPLDMPIETKTCDGKKYYVVNGGDYLVACFEPEISEKLVYEIANLKPTIAVFRDSSFATAKDKVNVTEIFKNITGRDDCVKVL